MLLLCSTNTFGQFSDSDVVLIGPVYAEKVVLSIGYAKELGSGFYVAGFSGFGKTVEAEANTFKLFSIWKKLCVGPVLGGGVDWSEEAGDVGEPTLGEIFGAAGAVTTYTVFDDKIGVWGFWKRNIAERANVPVAGVGLYYIF